MFILSCLILKLLFMKHFLLVQFFILHGDSGSELPLMRMNRLSGYSAFSSNFEKQMTEKSYQSSHEILYLPNIKTESENHSTKPLKIK